MGTLADLLRGAASAGRRAVTPKPKLPRSVVKHSHYDKMVHGNFVDESPRFKRITVDDAPKVAPAVEEPGEIDFTTATPDEIKEWQAREREAQAKKEQAPPYSPWPDLTRDLFYSYVGHNTPEMTEDPVDPRVELHQRIVRKIIVQDEHAATRSESRDDPVMSGIATMAAANVLRDALGDELAEQAQQAQEIAEQTEQAEEAEADLEDLRGQAQEIAEDGEEVPQELIDQIKDKIRVKRGAQGAVQAQAADPQPMSLKAIEAIEAAAKAGETAANKASNLPSFGSGFGQGEPRYNSPEQALSIAEMWADNEKLRAMAELFGRLDPPVRSLRAKRVLGGQDEIVDVEFGDNLSRVLPAELAMFADDDLEDDFLARYVSGELLVFSTVGEEHAGRGPTIIVIDGSYSMNGQPNIWARAVAMCLLHIMRIEKRDFACIEFSGDTQYEQWSFPAQEALDPERILDMAAHFYGGGTTPIIGVQGAAKLMDDAAPFRKADLVMIGDGIAPFTTEDKLLRDKLKEMGVRIFGIGIGGPFAYLEEYCDHVVNVQEFDLADPSRATAELATHIS